METIREKWKIIKKKILPDFQHKWPELCFDFSVFPQLCLHSSLTKVYLHVPLALAAIKIKKCCIFFIKIQKQITIKTYIFLFQLGNLWLSFGDFPVHFGNFLEQLVLDGFKVVHLISRSLRTSRRNGLYWRLIMWFLKKIKI